MDLENNQIIYVGDPMCSWCYGIAGELEKLISHYQESFSFKLVMGGLRPKGTETLGAKMREMLKHHWEQVESRSGQKFNYGLLEKDSEFVYDTEIPCRAVVAVRKIDPSKELSFYNAVQKAFYFDNKDTNNPETYTTICKELGIDSVEFNQLFEDEKIKYDTWQEFAWAQQVGVTGFPSVLLFTNDTLYAIALGYNTFDGMNKAVESILSKTLEKSRT